MARKGLTYEEARAYAIKNYEKGGDVFVECWDERTFNDYVKMFGCMTKATMRRLFSIYDEQYKAATI